MQSVRRCCCRGAPSFRGSNFGSLHSLIVRGQGQDIAQDCMCRASEADATIAWTTSYQTHPRCLIPSHTELLRESGPYDFEHTGPAQLKQSSPTTPADHILIGSEKRIS